MKLLRLRRNLVKLSLYRHFTNTLIFAVIGTDAHTLFHTLQSVFVSQFAFQNVEHLTIQDMRIHVALSQHKTTIIQENTEERTFCALVSACVLRVICVRLCIIACVCFCSIGHLHRLDHKDLQDGQMSVCKC